MTAKKWLDSIEKQKRSNLKFATDRRTYIRTESTTTRSSAIAGRPCDAKACQG